MNANESGEDRTGQPSPRKVLVVDDDAQILKQIQRALSDSCTVFTAMDRSSALEVFRAESTPVVLLDLGLPPRPRDADEGLLTLSEMLREASRTKVIIVSGNSDRMAAVSAIENGAYDIFSKPIDTDELRVVLQRVWKRLDLEREGQKARLPASVDVIIGSSPPLLELISTLKKVAATDVPVLIVGESGTGKELLAEAIHLRSPRKDGPFVPINCGAIPDQLLESELFGYEKGAFTGASSRRQGKLEYAQGGTLFLDEIGDLAPALQVKLLRFLQQKVIERVGGRESIALDCRVVAATNRDLEAAVREEGFREDLYFRLAVVQLVSPPLRERGNDVLELAEHFLAAYAGELAKPARHFSADAISAMRGHRWPGNVRELQNRIRRAVVLSEGPVVGAAELELGARGGSWSPALTLRAAKKDLERELIARALEENRGNVSRTARALGVSRPTLYEMMAKHGLGGKSGK